MGFYVILSALARGYHIKILDILSLSSVAVFRRSACLVGRSARSTCSASINLLTRPLNVSPFCLQ